MFGYIVQINIPQSFGCRTREGAKIWPLKIILPQHLSLVWSYLQGGNSHFGLCMKGMHGTILYQNFRQKFHGLWNLQVLKVETHFFPIFACAPCTLFKRENVTWSWVDANLFNCCKKCINIESSLTVKCIQVWTLPAFMADGKHSRSWSFHFVAEMEEIQTYEEGQNLSIVFNGKQIPLVKLYWLLPQRTECVKVNF